MTNSFPTRRAAELYPDRFDLFGKHYVAFGQGSQPTLNGWLGAYKGAEGMKTGFTCGSGYNLVAAATRGGRRLIGVVLGARTRSEEHTSELQSLMRLSYAVFCFNKTHTVYYF